MRERLKRLVCTVRAHQGIASHELADVLGVSERTVRAEVAAANDALAESARIMHHRGDGYELEISDLSAFNALIEDHCAPAESIPSTPEERSYYLLNDLLWRSDWVTIETLASVLYVSRRTVSNDLRRVEQVLASYGLSLESRPYAGLRVTGPELARRLCLAGIVMARLTQRSSGEPDAVIEAVGTALDATLRETGYQISSLVYQNLVVHIAVAVERMRTGSYVPWDDGTLGGQRKSETWRLAQRIAADVGSRLDISFPEEEIAYIALHLAARQSTHLDSVEMDDDAGDQIEGGPRAAEAWELVAAMVERVRQLFHYDFSSDLELRMNLVRHVEPLLMRLRYHLSTPNPLLPEIKERYPLAYQFALESSTVLSDHVGVRASEEEIGYLALAFALALERMRTAPARKNVLIVCASGAGSARLLQARFEREFNSCVGTVATCDVLHLAQQDFSNIDYVFTTVPVPPDVRIPVPMRQISFFFDAESGRKIYEDLVSDTPARPTELPWLRSDLFFPHLSVESKQEVIDVLCDHMASCLGLGDELKRLVLLREKAAPTAFGNLVALPHPLRSIGNTTAVCVGLLDKDLDWDGQPVRAVFLIVVADDYSESLSDFYQRLTRLFSSTDAVGRITEKQEFDVLARELAQPCAPKKGETE